MELRIESSKTPEKTLWLQPVELNLLALFSLTRFVIRRSPVQFRQPAPIESTIYSHLREWLFCCL
jgi:hypothetical protein